jgi:DNA polymerase
VSEIDELAADLAALGRYYASLTGLGVPAEWIGPPPPARGPRDATMSGRVPPSVRPAAPEPAAAPPPDLRALMGMPPAAPAPKAGRQAAPSIFADAPPPPDAPDVAGLEASEALATVRAWVGDCQRCKLAKGRKSIVFGQGNPQAQLMFVGEAPGADEDEQGLAFVGRAGQLLTDIIEKGLKIPRAEVYICNVIKCRPPGNRNPEPDEILACQPFLERQILSVRPRLIVGLGKFACQFLLKTAEPITRLRGKMGTYLGIEVMPTYHPAYLLRNPSAKRDVWEDMKAVLQRLKG